jgi:hypothetical protein
MIRSSDPADDAVTVREVLSPDALRAAIAAFDGDETAEMLFEGTVDGMEGQELREFLGLSQTDFDSKRRFVRRRLNLHFERNDS